MHPSNTIYKAQDVCIACVSCFEWESQRDVLISHSSPCLYLLLLPLIHSRSLHTKGSTTASSVPTINTVLATTYCPTILTILPSPHTYAQLKNTKSSEQHVYWYLKITLPTNEPLQDLRVAQAQELFGSLHQIAGKQIGLAARYASLGIGSGVSQ